MKLIIQNPTQLDRLVAALIGIALGSMLACVVWLVRA